MNLRIKLFRSWTRLKNINILEWLYNSSTSKKLRIICGAKTIHCLGDSHVLALDHVSRKRIWLQTVFEVRHVNGATALGLVNPNSKTNAFNIFHDYVRKIHPEDHLLFCFGEVDCGFVIWYRAKKYGACIDEQLQESLNNYINFLENIRSMRFERIIITSVPLPTIRDGQHWGDVANLRKDVSTSLRARTDLTIAYNDCLRTYCKSRDCVFLDLEKITLDNATRLVKEEFRNPNPLNHHLSKDALVEPLSQLLRSFGYK